MKRSQSALKLGRKESLGLRDILRALVREGELLSDSRYRYGTAEQFGAKKGTFSGNERGFGFVIPEDGSPDLFILPAAPSRTPSTATRCLLIPVRGPLGRRGGNFSRPFARIHGACRAPSAAKERSGYLHPDERKYTRDVLILPGKTKQLPAGEQGGRQDRLLPPRQYARGRNQRSTRRKGRLLCGRALPHPRPSPL